MKFPSRKSIMTKNPAKESGRKRPREEGPSGVTPPPKVPVLGGTENASSSGILTGVTPESTPTPPPVTTPLVSPTEATTDSGLAERVITTPEKLPTEVVLDLELSLRQKKDHDINASGMEKSTEKEVDMLEASKDVDLTANDDTAFEFVKRGTSTSGRRRHVDDTVSSSGTGTFSFINVPSDSNLKVSDSGNLTEVNKYSVILPANQDMTFHESMEIHGIDMNTGPFQHDTEPRVDEDRPITTLQPPPRGQSDVILEGPGESSTPVPNLSQAQISEKILCGVEEIKRLLQQLDDIGEVKKMLQQLVDVQTTMEASAGLAGGVVADLRSYVSRIPNSATMNVTFCGLMVAARLGHLTPYILEDPVILCLLGDRAEDIRQMIANSLPAPYCYRGPQ